MFEEIQWGKLATYIIGILVAFSLIIAATVLINRTVRPYEGESASENEEKPQSALLSSSAQGMRQENNASTSNKPQSEEIVKDQYEHVTKELASQACTPSEKFLMMFFSHAEQETAWDEQTKRFVTEEAVSFLEEQDSRLIRKQELAVPPRLTNALKDEYPRVAYCEGASTLTGWLVTMEQKTPGDPWLVQNFQPREPELAFYPRRFLEGSDQ